MTKRKPKSEHKPTGRPTDYTEEAAAKIIEARLTKPLRQVLREDESLPSRQTVYNWFTAYPDFFDQYVRACEVDADNEFDDLISLADKCDDPAKVQLFKLQIDTRKWVLSKRCPKKYGDKTQLVGDKDNPISLKWEVELVNPDNKDKDA